MALEQCKKSSRSLPGFFSLFTHSFALLPPTWNPPRTKWASKMNKWRKKNAHEAHRQDKIQEDEIKFKQTLVHIKNYYDFFPLYFRIVDWLVRLQNFSEFCSFVRYNAKQNKIESDFICVLQFLQLKMRTIRSLIIIVIIIFGRFDVEQLKLQLYIENWIVNDYSWLLLLNVPVPFNSFNELNEMRCGRRRPIHDSILIKENLILEFHGAWVCSVCSHFVHWKIIQWANMSWKKRL